MDKITKQDLENLVDTSEKNTSLNLEEARFPLTVSNDIFDKFVNAANHLGFSSVETWAISTLIQSLNTKVGAAVITSPSEVSGQSAAKITGPSYSGMVRRG